MKPYRLGYVTNGTRTIELMVLTAEDMGVEGFKVLDSKGVCFMSGLYNTALEKFLSVSQELKSHTSKRSLT